MVDVPEWLESKTTSGTGGWPGEEGVPEVAGDDSDWLFVSTSAATVVKGSPEVSVAGADEEVEITRSAMGCGVEISGADEEVESTTSAIG